MRNAVVIVTYNRIELLKECLGCVKASDIPFCRIIVVDNKSTDGTCQYLDQISANDESMVVLHQEENLGGAGGFYKGLEYVKDLDFDYLLIIDDDAMIAADYMSLVVASDAGAKHIDDQDSQHIYSESHHIYSESHHIYSESHHAFAGAGAVMTEGQADVTHRRRLKSRLLFLEIPVGQEEYKAEKFNCQFATFCGLVLNREAFNRCGLPRDDFFLWYDDSEYCLRLWPSISITVVPKAIINHKTTLPEKGQGLLQRITWRQYYGYRNRYFTARNHLGKDSAAIILLEYRLFYFASFFMSLSKNGSDQGRYNMQLLKDVIHDCKAGRTGIREEYTREKGRQLSQTMNRK